MHLCRRTTNGGPDRHLREPPPASQAAVDLTAPSTGGTHAERSHLPPPSAVDLTLTTPLGHWPGDHTARAPRRGRAGVHRLGRHPGARRRPAGAGPVPGGRPGRGRRRTSTCSPTRRSSSASRSSRWPAPARPRTSSWRSTPRPRPAATPRASTRCHGSWPGRTPPPSSRRWPCDVVLNGITGSIGLGPTLAALEAGRTLALANKESLVAGGPLVKAALRGPDQIVPVDSEHSALAQCLRGGRRDEVRRLVLTASGGPFRGRTRDGPARRHRRAGAGAPDLGHGPGRHDQLGDPGEQGPRAASRPTCSSTSRSTASTSSSTRSRSCTRWSSSSTARRWPRRARRTCGCRSRSAWAGRTGCPDAAPRRATGPQAATWEFEPLDDDAFPAVGLARAAGQAGGTAPAVLQRGQRGVRRGVPRRVACASPASWTRWRGCSTSIAVGNLQERLGRCRCGDLGPRTGLRALTS